MPATERASLADKYRCERPACDRELTLALKEMSARIRDPVAKLRYLRNAVDAQCHEQLVRHLPCAPARRQWYRWRGRRTLHIDAMARSARAWRITIPIRATTYLPRTSSIVAALLIVPVLAAGVAFGVGQKPRPEATIAVSVPAQPKQERPGIQVVAEPIARDVRPQSPGTIWLADRGAGWELYSNGLRIETKHVVAGEARHYRIHDRAAGLQPTVYTRPVGILFHTSESDLWPLEPGYRSELRRSTSGLLKWVRENQSYNYLIDRFGRVYRVVDDDSRARHAGNSVWARGDEVYLDLNAAFLGISFESRSEGARLLPITAAQLNAGRSLTDYLRQRFAIAPEMCVTHGLASVSPRQHLIGYHRDWARGFPFEAFGLPDLYARPTPSVVLFGFGYDAGFQREVGELWPGLAAAQDDLAHNAAARAISPAELRNEGRALYRQWTEEIRSGTGTAGASVIQRSVDK